MKLYGRITLCLLLALCILVSMCACSSEGATGAESTVAAAADGTSDTRNDPEPMPPASNGGEGGSVGEEKYETVTLTQTYLPKDIRAYYEKALSEKSDKFNAYSSGNAPYAIQDAMTISGCMLKKIAIPVYNTGALDADGKLVFTLFVHESSFVKLKREASRVYKIKIDPTAYGITASSTVMRFIEIDVSDYGIKLADNETLAMYAATDTVIPAWIPIKDPANANALNEVAKPIVEDFPQAQNFYSKVGTASLGLGTQMLLYDFEWEKTYTAEEQKAKAEGAAELDSLKKLLREKYEGKYVSILGDSISTFENISNNTSHNATIGNNAIYYNFNDNPHTWEQTYWGRLIADTGMKLCVSNAWSGSRVYGKSDASFKDSAPYRAMHLDRADGTAPDVIIMYMGINDLHNASPFGDLYNILKDAPTSQYDALIKTWFDGVLSSTQNGTVLNAGTTYTTFEQAYALSLYLMTQKYRSADILCLGMENNTHSKFTTAKQEQYDLVISALAQYFGCTFVDQTGAYSEIDTNNMHHYTMDTSCLHPNSMGHAAMSRMIMRALADICKKNG